MQQKGCLYEAQNFIRVAVGTDSCACLGESENPNATSASAAVPRSHTEGACPSVAATPRVSSGREPLCIQDVCRRPIRTLIPKTLPFSPALNPKIRKQRVFQQSS